MKKLLSMILIIGMMSTVLVSCTAKPTVQNSSSEQISGSSKQSSAVENIVLTFVHSSTEKPERALYFDQLASKYNALHPNVTIKITKSTFTDLNKAILTALSANQPFDIFAPQAGPGDTKIWLEKDALLDLTQYVNGDTAWKNTFRPGIIEAVTYGDGKIYNIPFYEDSAPLNYHIEIFTKDKVEPAKNKTEFYALCEKFKAEGYTPFQLHGSMMDDFLCTIALQFEAKYKLNPFDVVSGKVPYTDPWFMDALTIVKEMYDKGYLPKNFWTINGTEGRMAYSTSKMPMKFGFYWDVDTHKDMGMKYEDQGVASLPNFTGDDSVKLYKPIFMGSFMISKACKYPEAAVDFLKFMTNTENQDDLAYKFFGRYPNGMPVVNKNVQLSAYAQKYADDTSKGLPTTFNPMNVSLKFGEVLTAQLPLLMQGQTTVEKVAAEFEKLRQK